MHRTEAPESSDSETKKREVIKSRIDQLHLAFATNASPQVAVKSTTAKLAPCGHSVIRGVVCCARQHLGLPIRKYDVCRTKFSAEDYPKLLNRSPAPALVGRAPVLRAHRLLQSWPAPKFRNLSHQRTHDALHRAHRIRRHTRRQFPDFWLAPFQPCRIKHSHTQTVAADTFTAFLTPQGMCVVCWFSFCERVPVRLRVFQWLG